MDTQPGTIFGREPAMVLALVQASIALVVAFGLNLAPSQIGAIFGVTAVILVRRGVLLVAKRVPEASQHASNQPAGRRAGVAAKRALDDRAGTQLLLETLAWMAAESGEHQRAATLLGCAERVRQSSAIPLLEAQPQQHERSNALALEGLGQRLFDAARERGLAMTIDDAVAFAVEENLPSRPVIVRTANTVPLTKRELEIAQLIRRELTSREIATQLFISERTVETHVTNMLNKLGLNSRV